MLSIKTAPRSAPQAGGLEAPQGVTAGDGKPVPGNYRGKRPGQQGRIGYIQQTAEERVAHEGDRKVPLFICLWSVAIKNW